jgi:hypothetical protein
MTQARRSHLASGRLTRLWFAVHGWIGTQLGVLMFVILFSATRSSCSSMRKT